MDKFKFAFLFIGRILSSCFLLNSHAITLTRLLFGPHPLPSSFRYSSSLWGTSEHLWSF